MQKALEYLQSHREEQLALPEVPHLATAIFDHSLAHTQAELSWLSELLQKLEKSDYP